MVVWTERRSCRRGDVDRIVGEGGEGAPEFLVVDSSDGAHEGVELTVAHGAFLKLRTVYHEFHCGRRVQALREAERVVVDADFRRDGLVFEHVGHYEWQIVRVTISFLSPRLMMRSVTFRMSDSDSSMPSASRFFLILALPEVLPRAYSRSRPKRSGRRSLK